MKKTISYLMFIILSFIVVSSVLMADSPSAWDRLISSGEDPSSISAVERRVFQVLSPEQAMVYLKGEDPENIALIDGRTLALALRQQAQERAAGLALTPLDPCELFRGRISGHQGITIRVDSDHPKELEKGKYRCGVPKMRGDEIRTHKVRALLLSLRVEQVDGEGVIKVWPGGEPEPDHGVVHFGDASTFPLIIPTLMIRVCDEESFDPCRDGDINLMTEEGSAHVVLTIVGMFEPVVSLSAPSVSAELDEKEPDSLTVNKSAYKSAVPPLWEQGTSGDLYYGDGNIGIGSSNPESRLFVTFDDSSSGEPDSAVTVDAESNSSSSYSLTLRVPNSEGGQDHLMRVRADGNVAIGQETLNDDVRFQVKGTYSDAPGHHVVRISTQGSGHPRSLCFKVRTSPVHSGIPGCR